MHADEVRDPSQIEKLRIAEATHDPVKVYSKLQRAIQESQTGGVKLKDWQQERFDLKRRISNAHEALNNERKTSQSLREELEAEKQTVADLTRQVRLLREQLVALRTSTTMRAGKIVAAPYRFSNQALTKSKRVAKEQLRFLKNLTEVKKVKELEVGAGKQNLALPHPPEKNEPERAPQVKPKSKGISATPQPSVERQLNDAWYNRGSISESYAILQALGDNTSKLSDKGLILKKRVEGAYRLFNGQLKVPNRSQGCAYTPENQRIMYAVHSTPIFNSNGYSTRTRGVAEGMQKEGGDVVVVARSGYPWDSSVDTKKPGQKRHSEELNGVTYVHTPGGNLNRDSLDHYILKAADSYVREARLLRPSIIQSASNHRTALPALIAARRVGVPFVYEVRGLWEITELTKRPELKGSERFNAQVELETLVALEADTVLAITNQVADELVARGIPREKIHVVPNAVDTHEFLPLPEDSEYAKSKKFDPTVPTIGFAGSIVEYEGLTTLIDASARLSGRGVAHQIVIAGSGESEASLKDQAKKLKLSNVHFLGRLPQTDIPRLMSTFDIVACPRLSNEITELVSPLKPLESFASGKPTVLSDVAPNIDLAGEDSSRAQLFEAGNPEDLADKIAILIEEKQSAVELARRARLWTVRERQWTMIGKMMMEQHALAAERSAQTAHDGKPVHGLKVGLISDEFTATTLAGTFDVEKLGRTTWRDQIQLTSFDLIFVESAWEGNDAEWHRGVGYYSDEESADLRGVLSLAQEKGIPTVFWNKEDPVHFSRFAPNAVLFDHVATTDANMIEKYLNFPGSMLKTASALPFYAQPSIHNPLRVDREIRDTVSYAGTYYGKRYADRSKDLEKLLAAALPHGLEIYDRQADNPDSPYKFPAKYQRSVQGAIPYMEVVESYKTHLAHLNVNSVTNSPTMFSRRVIEIPASGGLVLSAAGRGIVETLGNTIAVSNSSDDYRAFLHSWVTDHEARLREIWLQMRTIYRAHTARTALTVLCRTVGMSVSPAQPATYGVNVEHLDKEVVSSIAKQSVLPRLLVATSSEPDAVEQLRLSGIRVVATKGEAASLVDYLGNWIPGCHRTYFEDLLTATNFGDWDFIRPLHGEFDPAKDFIAEKVSGTTQSNDLVKVSKFGDEDLDGVVLHLPQSIGDTETVGSAINHFEQSELVPGTRVLIAGHDLKFAGFLIEELERRGLEVDIDQWAGHAKHDEKTSKEKLALADVVFCEWGLGNAVWYSKHLQDHQRMIVRVHLQELTLPYLRKIAHSKVDKYLFVGELIRQSAIVSHGVPPEKATVMPNAVLTTSLKKPKAKDARFGIGFVGVVPQRKRIDSALDLLELLQETDERYHLRIKGKLPNDYPWMKRDRKEEFSYYEEQFKRIEQMNEKNPGSVIFDGFGSDMAGWYSKVGIAISVSDFESFHLTIADGAASGSLPVSMAWDGADLIYPDEWLVSDVDEMADLILNWNGEDNGYSQFIQKNFEADQVADRILSLLAG
ncbi:Putative glycosyltransferase EpsF [Corynebacterium faecale]|uniref:glycosyltransferase n=1 Tax=Corynebacterium faecale TaxID=1758466 RepID=UPI0025B3A62B|nr:glycosyltransferase [Corynebacterium faecale]WJY91885.1 Putative glycosyltransferase EpsF [Corynebacterium faecale]